MSAPWLQFAPGMPALVVVSKEMSTLSRRQDVSLRTSHHGFFADSLIRGWQLYEDVAHRIVPSDAVMAIGGVGNRSYFVPSLTVIDTFGLADATVARNPVNRTNSERRMAHDRNPPPGYLQRRGVNIRLYTSAATEAEALARANYAINGGPGIWMPFNVFDHVWANERFGEMDLRSEEPLLTADPAGNHFTKDGVGYVGEQFLGRFDRSDLDGWHREVKAVTNHALAPFTTGSTRFAVMWAPDF